VAGSAAEVLPVSPICPLPLRRIHPPPLLDRCFFVFTKSGGSNQCSIWTAVGIPFLAEKRGGKGHLGVILHSAVPKILWLMLHSQPLVAVCVHGGKAEF
jgi:hypothetical protein